MGERTARINISSWKSMPEIFCEILTALRKLGYYGPQDTVVLDSSLVYKIP